MSGVEPYGVEYVDAEWPHGLRCAKCDRLMGEGDRYATEWDSFINDTPVLLVVCLECALAAPEPSP